MVQVHKGCSHEPVSLYFIYIKLGPLGRGPLAHRPNILALKVEWMLLDYISLHLWWLCHQILGVRGQGPLY